MKCCKCQKKKGKHNCVRYGGMLCPDCCATYRGVRDCDFNCRHLCQQYERLYTSSIELTELGRGKVIPFSDSLFIPNIFECFICDLYKTSISVIEPTRIHFSTYIIVRTHVNKEVRLKDAYNVDAWKIGKPQSVGVPFFQIYSIGIGRIENLSLRIDNRNISVEVENNHVDTWLPSAYTRTENISKKEAEDIFGNGIDVRRALTYYGLHFWGNSNTLFAEIMEEKQYELSLDMIYDSPFFEERNTVIPFGIFFPFHLVNYRDGLTISTQSDILIDDNSYSMLMLPYEEKMRMGNLIPLQVENHILSSPKACQLNINEFNEVFHYDEYCILFRGFWHNGGCLASPLMYIYN